MFKKPGGLKPSQPPYPCGPIYRGGVRCRYVQNRCQSPQGGQTLEFKGEVRLRSEEGRRLKGAPAAFVGESMKGWATTEEESGAFCWLIVPTGFLGTRPLWSCGRWQSPGGEGIPPDPLLWVGLQAHILAFIFFFFFFYSTWILKNFSRHANCTHVVKGDLQYLCFAWHFPKRRMGARWRVALGKKARLRSSADLDHKLSLRKVWSGKEGRSKQNWWMTKPFIS